MTDSILNSTKKALGIAEEYTAFDIDILLHVNSALATLNQLGIGPEDGLTVEDETVNWVDFLGDNPKLNPAKTYVYLRVRLVFDPPATSFVIDAFQKQLTELEFRLNVVSEHYKWVNPNPAGLPEQNTMGDPVVFDGGVGY